MEGGKRPSFSRTETTTDADVDKLLADTLPGLDVTPSKKAAPSPLPKKPTETRSIVEEDASVEAPPHAALDAVLAREGIDRTRLSRLDFRPGERDAVVVPEQLEASKPAADDTRREN